jgi:hypothetical protein
MGKGERRLRNLSHSAMHSVANSKASTGGLLLRSTSHSNLLNDLEPSFNYDIASVQKLADLRCYDFGLAPDVLGNYKDPCIS